MRVSTYTLFSRRTLLYFTCILFASLFSQKATAQLIPGMRANGRPMNQGDTVTICIGSSVLYLNAAQNYSTVSWTFDVGNGVPVTSNTTGSVLVPYAIAGTFITWQVITMGSNRDSMYVYVKVNDTKPVAGFNFSPNNQPCGSTQINFTNTSNGNGLSYSWTFEPGSLSTLLNPSHQFLNAVGSSGTTTYPVKLVVTNDQVCKDSSTQNVTVRNIPDASIDRGSTNIVLDTFNGVPTFRRCDAIAFYQFSFINKSTTPGIISSYTIKWGDGTLDSNFTSWPVNTTIVSHTFPRGQSSMQIIAMGTNGCIGIKNYNVFLGTNPGAGLIKPPNTSICTNAPLNQLTFPITGADTNTIGTLYKITVNDGSAPVTYQQPPPSSYTHLFTNSSCGTISSDGNSTYPNAFSVNLTVSNPCQTSGATVTPIYVSAKPKAQFFAPQNVCANSSTYIYFSGSYGNVASGTCTNNGKLAWTISPSTYSTTSILGTFNSNYILWQTGSPYLYVNFLQPGIYAIKLYVGNDGSCGMDSITKTICVRLPPTASFTADKHTVCAPDTVSFTNTSPVGTCLGETYNWGIAYSDMQGCGGSANYTFTGNTSTGSRDAKIRFVNPGRYIITLMETAVATGCTSATYRDTIYVKAKPKITLPSPFATCVNNTISPAAIVSSCYSTASPIIHWTFSGGSPAISDSLNPGPIRYDTLGTYPIVLTATNECGLTTANATVQVMGKPDAKAGPDDSICSGIPTVIGLNTQTTYTYSWSPATGLNNPAIGRPTLTYTYNGSGTDTTLMYILTVSGGTNCSNKDTVLITVKKKPVVVVSPATVSVCSGQSVTLIAAGAATYLWTPAATLNVNNQDTVIATPTNPSTSYTVTGTVNGCTATATATVTVTTVPIPNAGPDTTACNNSTSLQLTGTPAGGVWSGHPNITSGGLFNPAAAGIGTYILYYTVGSGSCIRRDSAVVSVVSVANPANAGSDFNICQQPGTYQLIGQPAGGTWSGSLQVTSGGALTTSTPGVYTLVYRTGGGSCISRDTVIVTINGGINNNLISTDQAFCYGGQPMPINGQTISGGNGTPQYQWQDSIPGGIWSDISGAIGQNYTPLPVMQTRYYRRRASTTLCAGAQTSSSLPVKITLNPDAKAIFTPTRTVSCNPFNITADTINLTPYSNANSQYQWYVNGSPWSSNQTFPTYTMYTPGDSITIKLVAISRYGCKNDSMQVGFKTIPRPLPAFTQTDSVGCGPLTVTFTNNTPNASQYSYLWLFGTGIPSMVQQPGPITFPTNPLSGDTVYTVRFITISQCSRDTLVRYVRVKSKPKALFTPDRSTGCSTYNFAFTNTSRGIGNTYVWNYGDGSPLDTTQAAVVHHIYHVAGNTTFQVKLKATNECGSDSLIYNIVVQPISIHLDFAINGSNRYGCLPHTVSFINNSQGGNIFTYDFGDGTPQVPRYQNIDTVPHTYTTTGTFTVVLRGKNDCSDTTDTELVTVYPKPSVSFTASPLIACFGDTIRFTNNSDTGLVNNWRFGDGSMLSPLRNPIHIYNSGGNYRVWYTGTRAYPSGTNCADSTYKDIIIRDTLAGSFSASDTVAGCTPATIIFKNNNRPSAGTTWTFGDGSTAAGDSVSHNYLLPGTYLVKMISHGLAGCTYTATKTILVTSPGGTLLYNGGYLCPGIPLRMEVIANSTTQQIKYVYGDGDSTITTAPVVFHNYLQPGIYVPYAYAIAGSCRAKLVRGDTIKVDKLRTGFTTQNVQQCGSTTVMFTDTSFAYFGIQSRIWSFGDGTTSVQQNPVHNYTQSGTYPVRLRITGVSGCTDTALVQVTVSVRNFPVSTISGNVLSCIGQPLPLTALVQSGDSISSYNWNFGNGTIGSGQNVTATYNVAGSYTIRLISRTAFGCADTAYKTIMVNAAPFVDAGPDPFAICRGNSTQLSAIGVGVTSWQWSPLQNLSCTTCPNPMANPLFTTTYVVTGSNGALCKGTDTIVVEVIQPFRITVSPTAVFCYPDSVRLMAAGANTYLWSPAASLDNANISNPLARPAATTVYQVVGKGRNNCFTDTGYVRVNVGQYPIVDLGNGGTVTAGTPVTMTPVIINGPIIRYRWTPPTDLSCTNCPRPTAIINKDISYRLEVENNFGCIGSDTINYRVNCKEDQLFIPNAFSPDGDGTNDVLMVRGKGISVVKYFRIFNRWGQLVFERSNINVNDLQQGWDGKVNGLAAQPDVYVYTVEALCSGGATFTRTGNVSLIK